MGRCFGCASTWFARGDQLRLAVDALNVWRRLFGVDFSVGTPRARPVLLIGEHA